MALSQAQKSDIITEYRQIIGTIMEQFAAVKGVGDRVALLGLLDPTSPNALTDEDFQGANAAIDLDRFAAAAQAMAALDAAFTPEIRTPFYAVMP